MGWWIEGLHPPPLSLSPGWLPSRLNNGWTYSDRLPPAGAQTGIVAFYAGRYPNSSPDDWERRLARGEISRNGDRLLWHRPPWQEPAVPGGWGVIHDDGDLLVIDKPSGLPVLPAGGFLEHTLLRLLERQTAAEPAAAPPPRPVHRLGRFTSGLLVCARRPATRAWLSKRLRESSAAGEGEAPSCRKIYRTLLLPGALELELGVPLRITIPIGRRAHPLLGTIWCAAPDGLAASSLLTLLRCHPDGDLAQVEIATGRPHQIRIHCAAVGAPLLGDPLYLPGGSAQAEVLPGDGGYRLHAHRLALAGPDGARLAWEAPLPAWGPGLASAGSAALEGDQA
ncbi:pseudouridine synthase [Synechococcus sp. CS-1332]|uniref:pseudouridine synthase n=1 Tax=Synechococcus sp. CS-1332 TaxID=2847972 RepID=UPI00223B1AFA|nr:pseudouridine synthase [Synechococcus sp. CS-1332]MCT0207419.1 RNA pseudouridine synthase [Synechococcus sp. CS-1332]